MADNENEKNNAHNQGEQDASKDLNKSSGSLLSCLAGGLVNVATGNIVSPNNYNPPSEPELKEKYDEGYNNTINQSKK